MLYNIEALEDILILNEYLDFNNSLINWQKGESKVDKTLQCDEYGWLYLQTTKYY